MQEIREIVLDRAAKLAAGDVAGVQALYTEQVVQFTLAPPLAHNRETPTTRSRLPHGWRRSRRRRAARSPSWRSPRGRTSRSRPASSR